MGDAYDVVVVGAGTGGYSAALRAAQLGKRVALVERDDRLGGTCLLRGCIPTKALLRSAEVLDTVRRAEEWGIRATGEPDREAIGAFRDRIVDKMVKGLTGLVRARGVEVVTGTARLVAGPAVEVDGRRLEAPDVVIATGSRPKLLPGVSVGERVVTSDEALRLASVPRSAVVIGAGAVGLEFASFYRSLGAAVTILEALPRIAPLEDEDVSKELARAFRRRGIQTHAGATVRSIEEGGDGVQVTFDAGETATVTADLCLVAVGRAPVTEGLGLEEAGVELDRGFVKVDGQLQTSVPHVWAVGDVAATPLQLAHVAFTEGIAVAERIAGLDVPEIDYPGIPRVTYCSPEVASVGLTEAQAAERGLAVEVERLDLRAIGKANIVGEGGIVKLVAERDGPVLGVHMVGPHVTDLISEGMLITNWEAAPAEVAALIHPHPSLSEALGEAHLALAGKPLHSP
ncbi:MAG TPA: dihydrolipoyl dehydrogenase [Actinomycetota bacterium]|nr:dihydrolipoyl dehydrogenase [Actinomycetota bacterium]